VRTFTTAGLVGALAAGIVVVHPDSQYGYWSTDWGPVPPPPPEKAQEWRWRGAGWYLHVRECMKQYRTYDPYTDTYRVGYERRKCRLRAP
jgi:hypothetical protein